MIMPYQKDKKWMSLEDIRSEVSKHLEYYKEVIIEKNEIKCAWELVNVLNRWNENLKNIESGKQMNGRYKTKQFLARELLFFMGFEDNEGNQGVDRVVSKNCKGTDGGYSVYEVVIKHPDGKFYQFYHHYDDEHGICALSERRNDFVICFEVEQHEVKTIDYKKIENEKT